MRTHWLAINILALIFAVLQSLMQRSTFGVRLENELSDIWFALRGVRSPPSEIVIVSLDLESYRRLNASPIKTWPRSLMVEFLRKIKAQNPEKVVIDIVFSGESTEPQADLELVEALHELPTVIADDAIPIGTGADVNVENMHPDPQFASAAGEVGRVTVPLDMGVVRRFRLLKDDDKSGLPTLAEAAVGMHVPTDPNFLLNYYGPAGSFRTVSIYQVIQEELPADFFRGKIVFVGYQLLTGAPDHPGDSFITPFSGNPFFGIEIHATAAANLLQGTYIRRASSAGERLPMALAVFMLSLLVLSFRPLCGALILATSTAAWAVWSYHAFLAGFFVPGLVAALLVLPFMLLASSIYYYLVVYRSRQQVREALSRYVSPEIAKRIADNPACHSYETESRAEVTMLFTDIRGFTGWAECNGNKEVLSTLNRYFSEIAAIVLDAQGTVMKYAGDGMFALWGAPLAVDMPSRRALQSALDIRRRVRQLGESGVLPFFETRAGLHRAEVSVGNLGERRRFDYTAVGDGVNITARLEDLNKKFGTGILLSEIVLNDLGGSYNCIKLGSVHLRGRAEPMTAYTLLEEQINTDLLEQWFLGLELLEQGRHAEGLNCFVSVAAHPGPLKVIAGQYIRTLTVCRYDPESALYSRVEEEPESGLYYPPG